MTSSDSSPPSWLLVWRVLLAIAIAAMPFWMWIAPGGFPVDHPRFWANRAMPAIVFAIAVLGLAGIKYQKYSLYQSAVLFLPLVWTSAVVCGIVTFPVSSRRVLLPVLCVAAFLWFAYAVTSRRQPRETWSLFIVILLATVMGIAAPLSQRAPYADTQPQPIYVIPPPVDGASADKNKPPERIQLSEHLAVRMLDGTIYSKHGNLRISIEPFLRFESRSPDRCWTLLAFADWATQCGVALSPTAGWGLPVNAIEFQRIGDDLDDPVVVWMTLAATSVGRGWDSVGHRAGTYRNRIEISKALE